MNLHILSPTQTLYSGRVDMVVFPGDAGDFGVLKHHAPLMSSLRKGEICLYRQEKIIQKFPIKYGFVQVESEQCTVYVANG